MTRGSAQRLRERLHMLRDLVIGRENAPFNQREDADVQAGQIIGPYPLPFVPSQIYCLL
jgi:hypothetical protein